MKNTVRHALIQGFLRNINRFLSILNLLALRGRVGVDDLQNPLSACQETAEENGSGASNRPCQNRLFAFQFRLP